MSRLFALLLLGAVGCKEPAKTEPEKVAAPVASSAPAAPSPSPPPAKPAHKDKCEVEVFAKVVVPAGTPKGGKLVGYVAEGDCLADDAKILGRADAGLDGAVVLEVFPKWGSDITVCGARDLGEGKATTLYGKAKESFHAESDGELTFKDVKIELSNGKPHVFPKAP